MVRIAFGPDHRYFFDDSLGNIRYRASPAFVDFFSRASVARTLCVAFGEGDSFFIAYTAADGVSRFHFKHDDRYPALRAWLFELGLAHTVSELQVSLGGHGAFFARSNAGDKWRNLPEGALDLYQSKTRPDLFVRERVHNLDIGYNGTYLGNMVNNNWFWDLGREYQQLQMLNPASFLRTVKFLTINPYAPDQHFIVFENNTVHFSLPQEWSGDIAQVLGIYAQQSVGARGPHSPPPPYHGRPLSTSPPPSAGPTKPPRFWRRASSSSSAGHQPVSPPPAPSSPPAGGGGGGSMGGAWHAAHNMYDQYNNVTNVVNGGQGGGMSMPDPTQAMSWMQNSVDTINSASNMGGQGISMMNNITNSGLMVSQMAGQFGGMAAACVIM